MEIKYCPTENMIADFFTKPLQGALFNRLRDVIMGKEDIHTFARSSVAKEREEISGCDGQTGEDESTERKEENSEEK